VPERDGGRGADRDAGPDAGDELLVEVRDHVGVVTLNRPAVYNAADEALHGALARVWPRLDADPEVRAVVLTGAGGAFSAGGDLDLLERMVADRALRDRIMAEGMEIVRAMTAVRVPIVAAVNGPAVGLGCSLASLCDLVVVEEDAYFADPHVAIGLVAADGGAITWPLLTGLLRAKEFILLGDRLSAAEALALGVANRVVPTGTAVDVAVELAQRLSTLPPQAVVETKRVLNTALRAAVGAALPDAISAETASFDEGRFHENLSRMRRRRDAR
jgi:enoyl-CoA hydratase